MNGPNRALAVVGDRRALAWVLSNSTVAFPEPRSRLVPFEKGDHIYLYTTRGCFGNPTRDRSRVIGKALALSSLKLNDDAVTFGDRTFPLEVRMQIASLAPLDEGIDFAALIPELTSFPKPERWSVYLRRSSMPITKRDADRLDKLLAPFEGMLEENIDGYRRHARLDRP